MDSKGPGIYKWILRDTELYQEGYVRVGKDETPEEAVTKRTYWNSAEDDIEIEFFMSDRDLETLLVKGSVVTFEDDD